MKHIFVGGRNLALEFSELGLDVEYMSAEAFLAVSDTEEFRESQLVFAYSRFLKQAFPESSPAIEMKPLLKKFHQLQARSKVVLSSVAVYGLREEEIGLSEEAECLGISDYAKERLDVERFFGEQATGHSEKITLLRPSSLIYSRIKGRPNLISRLSEIKGGGSQRISIESNGEQIRDFCTTAMLAKVVEANSERSLPKVLNVADVEAIKVKALVSGFLTESQMSQVDYVKTQSPLIHCSLDKVLLKKHFSVEEKYVFDLLS
jgi:hypothetical protein